MLLTLLPPTGDLVNFDTDATRVNPLQAGDSEPKVAFADLLSPGVALPAATEPPGGEILPPAGNLLPLIDAEVAEQAVDIQFFVDVEAEVDANGQVTDAVANVLAPVIPPAADNSPLAPGTVAPTAVPPTASPAVQIPTLPEQALRAGPRPAVAPAIALAVAADAATAGEGAPAARPLTTAPVPPAVETLPRAEPGPPPAAAADLLAQRAERRKPADTTVSLDKFQAADLRPAETRVLASPDTSRVAAWRELRPQPAQTAAPVPLTVAAAAQPAPSTQAGTADLPATLLATGAGIQPGALTPRAEAGLPPPAATQTIGTPVMDPAWGDELGQRVQVMASNRLQSAEIRLTPAELGPLRIQLSVEDGAANITFHAQHALTRDAIEQALPRLRDMLADSGLTLTQANIGEQGVQNGGRDAQDAAAGADYAGDERAAGHELELEAESMDRRARAAEPGDSLVDMFA